MSLTKFLPSQNSSRLPTFQPSGVYLSGKNVHVISSRPLHLPRHMAPTPGAWMWVLFIGKPHMVWQIMKHHMKHEHFFNVIFTWAFGGHMFFSTYLEMSIDVKLMWMIVLDHEVPTCCMERSQNLETFKVGYIIKWPLSKAFPTTQTTQTNRNTHGCHRTQPSSTSTAPLLKIHHKERYLLEISPETNGKPKKIHKPHSIYLSNQRPEAMHEEQWSATWRVEIWFFPFALIPKKQIVDIWVSNLPKNPWLESQKSAGADDQPWPAKLP